MGSLVMGIRNNQFFKRFRRINEEVVHGERDPYDYVTTPGGDVLAVCELAHHAENVAYREYATGVERGLALAVLACLAALNDRRADCEDDKNAAVHELCEAIRFTVEYIGTDRLPPVEGWSWYDALVKYAPEDAAEFRDNREKYRAPSS